MRQTQILNIPPIVLRTTSGFVSLRYHFIFLLVIFINQWSIIVVILINDLAFFVGNSLILGSLISIIKCDQNKVVLIFSGHFLTDWLERPEPPC